MYRRRKGWWWWWWWWLATRRHSFSTIASRDFFPRPPVYWISGVIAAGKSVFHTPSPGIYCSISDNSRGNKEPVSRLIPWFRTGVQTAVFDRIQAFERLVFIPLDRGKKIYIYIIYNFLFIYSSHFFSSLISLEFRDAFCRKVECKACMDEVRLMSAISIFPAFTGSSFQIWQGGRGRDGFSWFHS